MDAELDGHLFIVHGDLTRLSCDGILVPCDGDRAVSRWWFDMFEQRPLTEDPWEPLPAHARLRTARKGPIEHELVDTVSTGSNEHALVDAVHEALGRLAGKVGSAGEGRVIPLLALPMPGTGNGGLDYRRGAVVAALVPRLEESARELGVDVALVVRDRRDYAALQSAREPQHADLDGELVTEADRLGVLAAKSQLSVFVGAGVSVPLGLPPWPGLINQLLEKAGLDPIPEDSAEADLKEAASRAKRALGDAFDAALGEFTEVQHHALGHALIAGTRVRETITTNFDEALELAMATTHGDGLRVLTGQWATEQAPWLLKLHGTAGRGNGVVLTEEDYERHRVEGQPLYGLVQGLLITSHLLFVGFSLTDSNYLNLAKPVADLYARAGEGGKVATALGLKSLANKDHVLDQAFRHLSCGREFHGAPKAARTLEIFLDRVAWRATRSREGAYAYLLDHRYSDLVAGQGMNRLKEELWNLHEVAAETDGPAAARVLEDLQEFGATS